MGEKKRYYKLRCSLLGALSLICHGYVIAHRLFFCSLLSDIDFMRLDANTAVLLKADGGDGGQTEISAEAKAKERRQQVRRAQRQHRQRKANYTKQLEMDVTKLRDDIARVEQEIESLKGQNDAMRCQLTAPTSVTVPPVDATDTAFSTLLAPNYTVSLDVSERLGAPVYQVRRVSPSAPDRSSEATSSDVAETLSSTTPTSTAGTTYHDTMAMEMVLSQEQTDLVINFILAYDPHSNSLSRFFPLSVYILWFSFSFFLPRHVCNCMV